MNTKSPIRDYVTLLEEYSACVADGRFKDMLAQNTTRIQARLVLFGYELCGGQDMAMIARAAQAMELLRASVQAQAEDQDIPQARRALHEAEIILANLDADPENRIKVLSITNRTLLLVAMVAGDPDNAQAGYWRATEYALNPLHVGMVLAGADCHATNAVTPDTLVFGEEDTAHTEQGLTELFDTLRTLEF